MQGFLKLLLVRLDSEVFSTVPPYWLIASSALSGVTFSSIRNSAEFPGRRRPGPGDHPHEAGQPSGPVSHDPGRNVSVE